MKKVLVIMIIAAMLMVSLGLSALASTDPFAGKSSVNVVYLGGSITAGSGASAPEFKWVNKVGAYLAQTFPDKTINNYNVGLGGTGSDMGILRLQQDVISKNPDMVFIEFAVNDNSLTDYNAIRYMESIVLKLQQMPSVPYITYVYTTAYSVTYQTLNNKMAAHQQVADYYGIPSIDLQTVLAGYIPDLTDAEAVKVYLKDFTHPTDTGYAIYADEIISKLQTGNYYKKPIIKAKKLNAESAALSTKFVMAKTGTQTGTWAEADSGATIKSSVAGDTLTYEFEGPIFALQHRLSQNGGKYAMSIDGKTPVTIDTYYRNITSQKVLGYKNFNLGNGKHSVVITILADKNVDSGGTDIAFDNFISSAEAKLSKWVYEDFEDQNLQGIIPANAVYSYNDTETDNGGGALALSAKNDSANVQFGVNMQKDVKYRLSARIKMKDTAPVLNEVHFILQFRELLDDGTIGTSMLYNEPVIKNTNLTPDGWVKVETTYTPDGKGIKIGTSGQRFNVITEGIAEVRVGNGKLLDTTGSATTPIEYYLDDFIIEPVITNNVNADLIKSGSFDGSFDAVSWVKMNCNVTPVTDGANGTGGSVLIAETASYGGIKEENLPIKYNRAYKFSFYAKSGDTKGQSIYLRGVIDRAGKRQDSNIGNYDYMGGSAANDSFILTDSWQKFEYIYMNERITFDTSTPNFYFRAGVVGSTAVFAADKRPSYYIDEVKFEELETPYNGSFNSNILRWNAGSQMTYLGTDGANGTLGCIKIAQTTSKAEIIQGVDIRPGRKYKISFWAKVDSWANPLEGEQLPITAILSRNFTANAADTPPVYTGPTYQYLPIYPQEMGQADYNKSMFLTTEWKKYELEYNCNLAVDGYRTPKMQFRVGNGDRFPAVYYLDEIKIEEIASTPVVKNISVTGNAMAGETLTASFVYEGANAKAGYIYRVLSSTDSVNWVSVKNGETTGDAFTYNIKDADASKFLKFEVMAMSGTGELSPIASAVVENVKAGYSITPSFAAAWGANIQGNVAVINNDEAKPLTIVLALYDVNGKLCGFNSQTVNAGINMNDSLSISAPASAEAVKAKLFVWDGMQLMNPYGAAAELLKGE